MASIRALDRRLIPYAEALVHAAARAGLQPSVTSTRRSRQEQQRLYRAFKAGRSRFPAAPPGQSWHERGLAFDLRVNDARMLAALGKLWESWGGRWGGRFEDPIHFDAPRLA